MGAVHVVGGEVGQGAAAPVLELDASGPPRCRRASPVAAVQGPDRAVYITDDGAGAVYRLAPPGV